MHPPSPSSARPFLILSVALFSELTAGMLYWWPALAPGLQHALSLTPSQTTALVATANSGSVLGILGGIVHNRYGSRLTASLGAAGISLSLAAFAALVSFPLPSIAQPYVFTFCFVNTVAIVTFAYMLYSSCMTAAVAVFPEEYRGRVVGLCAAMYGASAGVFAALQAAWFPNLEQTKGLLVFAAGFAALPCVLTALAFPDAKQFELETRVGKYGGNWNSYRSVEAQKLAEGAKIGDGKLKEGITVAYAVCVALVIALQAAAVVGALGLSENVQRGCAMGVVSAMLCFAVLPLRWRLVVWEKVGMGNGSGVEELPPFITVLKDVRYLYLCMGFFVTVGGGGVSLLVQARALMKSRVFEVIAGGLAWDENMVGALVRNVVMVFATGNVTARLFVGVIADWGETDITRLLWKYDIMVYNSFFLMVAVLTVAAGSWVLIYAASALIGICHGTFFMTSPALTTLWFGVQSFPRNFALLGPFLGLASMSICSAVPSLFRTWFGRWVDVSVVGEIGHNYEKVCAGCSCTLPSFGLLAVLHLSMFLLGRQLRTFVSRKAECYET